MISLYNDYFNIRAVLRKNIEAWTCLLFPWGSCPRYFRREILKGLTFFFLIRLRNGIHMISLVAFVCKYPQQEFLILEQWKLKPCAESQETAPNFWLLILKPTVTGWLHRGQSVWGFWQQNIWGRIFICVFRLKYRKLDSYLQKVVFELIPFSNCGVRTHLEISRIPELRQSERVSLLSSSNREVQVHICI